MKIKSKQLPYNHHNHIFYQRILPYNPIARLYHRTLHHIIMDLDLIQCYLDICFLECSFYLFFVFGVQTLNASL